MIFLDTTTRSLEFLLGGTVTTNQLPFTSHYADLNSSFAVSDIESNNGVSNNITAVTLVAAPGASTFRQVKFLTIFNADTVNATVTVRYNDNTTTRVIKKTTLEPDWTLEYSNLTGIKVIDENGSIQESLAGIIPLASGGTAAALTAVNGGIAYSSATAIALSAAGTSGQILRSAGAAAPTWSTATYPATVSANAILYGTSANVVGESSTFLFTGNVLFVGDTSNANMTTGLTLNQGAADNEIITFKSSDVAHGITGETETDTYMLFTKALAASGGGFLKGYSAATTAWYIQGIGTTDNTAKTTAAIGYLRATAGKKTGTDGGAVGADANLFTIDNWGSTRFIFDAEGDSHEDGTGWTAYDREDDIALVEAVEYYLTEAQGNPIDRQFSLWLKDARPTLERLKLVTFNENGHHFVNRSRMQNLLCGVVRQLAKEQVQLKQEVAAVRRQLTD